VSGDTLQNYITNYNNFGNACQIGNLVFWGFNLADGPTAVGFEATAFDIQVLPVIATDIGINFNTGFWDISNGLRIDQIISYNVATLSGQALIKDATLFITGTLAGNGGSGGVTETLSPPVAGSPINASLPSTVSVNIDFSATPVSGFAVSNRMLLIGGPGNGDTAHISVIENDFSQNASVPEPVTTIPLGAGLVLFGTMLRKRLASKGAR
jgi:hypothetical protein